MWLTCKLILSTKSEQSKATSKCKRQHQSWHVLDLLSVVMNADIKQLVTPINHLTTTETDTARKVSSDGKHQNNSY